MADKKLSIVFTSDTKAAQKGIRDLNGALGSSEAQAKKSGMGLKTALGGLAIASFVKSGIDSLGEIDRVNKQTESAIRATGGAAKVTAGEVEGLAQAIEKKTGIEAESIQSGQNMLLTFKGIRNEAGAGNDIFNQATQTLADMSTAMGTDASTSAVQLGKALNDPIKGMSALSKVGVTFTQQQKDQIAAMVAAGDTMGAQKVILQELNSEFGGAAEGYGNSLPGKIAKAKNAFGDIQEAILSGLVPALEVASKAAVGFGTVMGGLPSYVQSGVVLAGAGAIAWSKWGEALSGAGSKVLTFGRTLNAGLDGIAATRGISKTQAGLEALKSSLGTTVSEFGYFKSGAAAAAAGLIAFGTTTSVLEDAAKFHGDLSMLGTDLEQLGAGLATVEDVAANFGGIEKLSGDFKMAYENSSLAERGWNAWKSAMTGDIKGFTQIRQAQSDIGALDQQLAAAVSGGNVEGARAAYGQLAASLIDQGVAAEDVAAFMPTYWHAIEQADRANQSATVSVESHAVGWGRLEVAVAKAGTAFQTVGTRSVGAFQNLASGLNLADLASQHITQTAMDVYSAQTAYDASTQALTEHQKEAGEVAQRNAEAQAQHAEAVRQHAQAVTQASDQVQSALKSEASARDALTEAQNAAKPSSDQMVALADRVKDAEAGIQTAQAHSAEVQRNLTQAHLDAAQALRDLAEANDDNGRSVEHAQLSYEKALAAQAKLAAEGSDDPFAKREAALSVADAADALDDAQKRAAESAANLDKVTADGVEKSPQVVAAKKEIADAAKAEKEANDRLKDAQKAQSDGQLAAQKAITAAQEGLAAATKGVSDAQANLATTQATGVEATKLEATTQTDLGGVIVANAQAKLALADATATANGKTLTAAERAKILKDGLDEGRAATGYWSGDLQTLSDKLDLASKPRTMTLETQEAMDKATKLGYKVETMPDGQVVITADTSQAHSALDALNVKISLLGTEVTGDMTAIVNAATGGGKSGGMGGMGKSGGLSINKGGSDLGGISSTAAEDSVYAAMAWHHAHDADGGKAWDVALTDLFNGDSGAPVGGQWKLNATQKQAPAAAEAAAGPTTIHVTIPVAGTLVAERDLVRTVVEAINEAGRRENRPLFTAGVAG